MNNTLFEIHMLAYARTYCWRYVHWKDLFGDFFLIHLANVILFIISYLYWVTKIDTHRQTSVKIWNWNSNRNSILKRKHLIGKRMFCCWGTFIHFAWIWQIALYKTKSILNCAIPCIGPAKPNQTNHFWHAIQTYFKS